MPDSTPKFLPYGRQCLDDDDMAAVRAVLESDWLTTGPAVERFETTLAECVGAKHAISCSSGTAGLHMALYAAGIESGDVVIVPAITFLATANAVRMVGAEVVFADVDPDNGLMYPEHIEDAVRRSTIGAPSAVIPVHLAGQCAPPAEIKATAKKHGMTVIEDAAHAVGTHYTDDLGIQHAIGACEHSDMAVFSFHPVKTVSMGEGGAVTTNDDQVAKRLSLFRSHGMTRETTDFESQNLAYGPSGEPNPWYYEMHDVGYNYRASDLHCALGASQLTKLKSFVAARRHLAATYDEKLAKYASLLTPIHRAEGCEPGWHLYPVLIDFEHIGTDRGTLMSALRQQGIGSQVHYIPVSSQPYYRQRYGEQSLPGADAYYARTLSIPMFVGMTIGDVDRVVNTLASIVAQD